MISVFEAAISYRLYISLQEIHTKFGWETVPYGYGRFPFSYIHKHSILLSHGAPPLTRAEDEEYENTVSIGNLGKDPYNPNIT